MTIQYLDFDLEIVEKPDGYETHVLNSPVREARAKFTLPFDAKDLALVRANVEKAVLRRTAAKAARRVYTPEVAELRKFGEDLFSSLIRDEVRDCFTRSWHEARKQDRGLRLKLRLPAPLGQIPWEFLYSPNEGDFLGLSIYWSIVRYLELQHLPVESLHVPAPLRILAVIANPQSKSLAALDIAREKRVIQSALYDLVPCGLIALDFLEGPDTLRQLDRRLRKETYHVLHFVGHGAYDEATQEGVLVMENEQGGEAWAGSETLSRVLRDARSVRLVFLNACQGAVTSSVDHFSSVAGALVRAGVPAVVAMQFEVTDTAAIILSQEFYTALADNFPVDAALAVARKQIAFEDPDSLEWATPVLFMRVADGRLFDVTDGTRRVPSMGEKEPPSVPLPPAEPPASGVSPIPPMAEQETPSVPLPPAQLPASGVSPIPPMAEQETPSAPPPSAQPPASGVSEGAPRTSELDELYDRALAAYHLGKWAEAVAGFQRVVEIQPDYEGAADKLAEARLQADLANLYAQAEAASAVGDWNAAIRHLEALTAQQADYRDAAARLQEAYRQKEASDLYAEARRLHRAREWLACLSALERLSALVPDYPDPDGLRASAEQAAQEQARKLADLYSQGLKALDSKAWAEAVECFQQVQATYPGYQDVAQLLAQAQAELDREKVLNVPPPCLVRPVDGQEMVLIPAGEFLMGSIDEEVAYWNRESGGNYYDDEKPQQKISLGAYYIDRTPITNAQYQKFVIATAHKAPDHWKEGQIPVGLEDHPVINVAWQDALAYCQWLNKEVQVSGYRFQVRRDGHLEMAELKFDDWEIRLPTEAEWEKAARGTDGRRWPWGNEWDEKRCNSSEGGKGKTTPVGTYSPAGDSPYGVADMAGNVWEWCQSLYRPYPYQADDGREDIKSTDRRVLRGGSWSNSQGYVRCAYRYKFSPDSFYYNSGFRVVFAPNGSGV